MKIGLVLTNDWELYGDGSGDFYEVQHNPTLDMLQLLNKYNAKMTFMAEFAQQLYHQKYGEIDTLGKIANDWVQILQKAIAEGHDAQLHFHPQWINAIYEDNKWHFATENWSIAKINEETISYYLRKGKDLFENELIKVNPNYKVCAFRAGAYQIEPSDKVIPILEDLGIKLDTSVTKGLSFPGEFDYSNVPSNSIPWRVGRKDIKSKGNSSVIEFPIYSEKSFDSKILEKLSPKLYYKLKFGLDLQEKHVLWSKERDRVKSIRYPRSSRLYKKKQSKSLSYYINLILASSVTQLDYDYLPAPIFVKLLRNSFDSYSSEAIKNGFPYLPVIASGHIKDAHNNDNLEWIFQEIEKLLPNQVLYKTLSELNNDFKNIL
jgi:hypothetical protein